MDSTIDFIEFIFDLNITTSTTYRLTVQHSGVDNTKTPYLHGGKKTVTCSDTIIVKPPQPSFSTANKLTQYNSFLCCFFYLLAFYL